MLVLLGVIELILVCLLIWMNIRGMRRREGYSLYREGLFSLIVLILTAIIIISSAYPVWIRSLR